jgi:hypothetical protein
MQTRTRYTWNYWHTGASSAYRLSRQLYVVELILQLKLFRVLLFARPMHVAEKANESFAAA